MQICITLLEPPLQAWTGDDTHKAALTKRLSTSRLAQASPAPRLLPAAGPQPPITVGSWPLVVYGVVAVGAHSGQQRLKVPSWRTLAGLACNHIEGPVETNRASRKKQDSVS